MSGTHKILILGASYGSLLATKLLLAGNDVTLVCLPQEAELINREGVRVRMPLKDGGMVEIASRDLPGRLEAAGPGDVDPSAYALIGLAMQEPQYRSPGVRELVAAIGRAKAPAMSIMNMPPLPYLKRLPGLATGGLEAAYADPSVWAPIDPTYLTLCSPDPQAFRPQGEPLNLLQVSLPTNFKVSRFEKDEHTAVLRDLEAGIDAARWTVDGDAVELPVKLRVHDSIFVPLAKWAMLLTGNYRCVTPRGPRAIRDAVHSDIEASRAIYAWVREVCVALGAAERDLVPFEKYAAAANGLTSPSSAARALFAGAKAIERVDLLVQTIAAGRGMRNATLDETVGLVNERLELNRRDAA
ncbi:hypothetical protein [Hansschlegelia zhihuaiae]|uniref:Ketopantoate reductase N-terminal domain-containing protein n=1 Tax=Hansschlegelia zhihuaiae TaxID=405005 RepID=A0A4Q0MI39_9HYPH|nr:hypothetical protein [Hansschlegelia zhihuaiae]RXF73210.1 hypothetical protein EK403_12085 [Hansschlegelia zhihuaiae]